jgi:hypothetical protein
MAMARYIAIHMQSASQAASKRMQLLDRASKEAAQCRMLAHAPVRVLHADCPAAPVPTVVFLTLYVPPLLATPSSASADQAQNVWLTA